MASIIERKAKNGTISYKIVVDLGRDDHDKKIRETTTYKPKATTPGKAKKEAEAFAVEFEKNVKEGTAYLEADDYTFNKFVDLWDNNSLLVKVKTGSMTKHCREDYLKLLNYHVKPSIGRLKLSKIKAPHIDKIVRDMVDNGKSAATIRKVFVVIHSVFDYAYRKDYIKENPCNRCDPLPPIKKRDARLHTFNEDQIKRFLTEALIKDYTFTYKEHKRRYNAYNGTHEDFTVHEFTESRSVSLQFRVFFTLAVYSGCRRGELIGLEWKDIDPERKTIRIANAVSKSSEGQYLKDPKTEAGKRTIKLPGECFELLEQWKLEQREISVKLGSAWEGYRGKDYDKNPVFIQTDSGKRMYIDSPTQKFKKILEAYNNSVSEDKQLPMIRLHDLRHPYVKRKTKKFANPFGTGAERFSQHPVLSLGAA